MMNLNNHFSDLKKQIRDILFVPSLRSILANKQFRILVFHRINDLDNPFFSGISSKIFEEKIHYCHRRFNVLPLENIVEYIISHKKLPLNSLAITFDDGYEDTFRVAYPILKKYNLPATIFLTTDFLDRKVSAWYDRLTQAIRLTKRSFLKFNLDGTTLEYNLSSRKERLNALKDLNKLCIKITEDEKKELLSKIESYLNVNIKDPYPMLSWDMVREMCRDGIISIGAHTLNHPVLTNVPLEEARRQIALSKQCLEDRLGIKIKLFAYPHGARETYSEEIKEILSECGFIAACTTLYGANEVTTDHYELRRIELGSRKLAIFALQIGGPPSISTFKLILERVRQNTKSWLACYVLYMFTIGFYITAAMKKLIWRRYRKNG